MSSVSLDWLDVTTVVIVYGLANAAAFVWALYLLLRDRP
jgi:hypothetical protein